MLAKLLLVKLDRVAAEPFKKVLNHYDEMIAGLAAHSAKSFLQVTEMAAQLEAARTAAETALKERAEAEFQRLKGQLDNDSQKRRMDESAEVKKDIADYLKKAFGSLFAAIVVLGLVNAGAQWIGSKVSSTDDAIDQRIERALARHVMISPQATTAAPVSGTDDAIDQRIERALARHVMISRQVTTAAPATTMTTVVAAPTSVPASKLSPPDAGGKP